MVQHIKKWQWDSCHKGIGDRLAGFLLQLDTRELVPVSLHWLHMRHGDQWILIISLELCCEGLGVMEFLQLPGTHITLFRYRARAPSAEFCWTNAVAIDHTNIRMKHAFLTGVWAFAAKIGVSGVLSCIFLALSSCNWGTVWKKHAHAHIHTKTKFAPEGS